MCSGDFLYLTKSILVRGLSKKQFDVLVDVSLKLNDLRNCAVESTYLIKKMIIRIIRKLIINQSLKKLNLNLVMFILLFKLIWQMLLVKSMRILLMGMLHY
jgi:hypothetical protein